MQVSVAGRLCAVVRMWFRFTHSISWMNLFCSSPSSASPLLLFRMYFGNRLLFCVFRWTRCGVVLGSRPDKETNSPICISFLPLPFFHLRSSSLVSHCSPSRCIRMWPGRQAGRQCSKARWIGRIHILILMNRDSNKQDDDDDHHLSSDCQRCIRSKITK